MYTHYSSLFLLLPLLFACNSSSNDDGGDEAHPDLVLQDNGNGPTGDLAADGLRMNTIQSLQYGLPVAQIALPADWRFEQDARTGNWQVNGTELRVLNTPAQMFMYSQDPSANQLYQQNGVHVRPPVPMVQVLEQDLAPYMQRQGRRLIAQENAAQVAAADLRGIEPMYNVAPTRKTCDANASTWSTPDGKRMLVVLRGSAFNGGGMVNWGYTCTVLETTPDRFGTAKQALLNGLAGIRYNPQYFAAYNAQEQQKAQQSWAQHNARMSANQRAFDAQQRQFQANSNAVNDAIMGGWRQRNAASDAGHDQFMDYIRDESNGTDPFTGQAIKVESGSQQYWMDQNGEYYGTDNVLDDPNANINNNDEWRQVDVEP
ncbi:MAG: hypothetical protein H6595_13250 [Flavobacteriales bacterium]|nr:hypothetical protein [Flavobacteriales bacterium]MCB9168432.1 hypothetical protein [Flavobacteriales bacterium]